MLANIFFILFSTITGAATGLLLSKFLISKDVGLAGGAMVLFYGALGLMIGFVLSLVLKNRIPKSSRKVLTIIMAIFTIAFIIWFGLQIQQQK